MATDMSITLNALPAKDSGKDVRRTAESQPASPAPPVVPVTVKQPVEGNARFEKIASASSPVSKEEVEGAVMQMRDFSQMLKRELQFDVDEDLGRTVVRVIDKDSGELIRQIPSEEVLELAKQMKEMKQSGEIGFDGKGFRDQSIGLLMKTQA